MKVYIFGNKEVPGDAAAIEVAEGVGGAVDGVSFVLVGPNEDVPFVDEARVVILDVVHGEVDYSRVISILRKLVAQDMHGS